jgi:flagellar biosynthesis chaperone FliJ
MAFAWKLQRVLDVTITRETGLKAELYRLSQKIANIDAAIARRRDNIRRTLREMADRSVAERMQQQEWMMRALEQQQREIHGLCEQRASLQETRAAKIDELAHLTAKKDTLDDMRTQARRNYDKALGDKEQKQLDEIFHIGFARRQQARFEPRSA